MQGEALYKECDDIQTPQSSRSSFLLTQIFMTVSTETAPPLWKNLNKQLELDCLSNDAEVTDFYVISLLVYLSVCVSVRVPLGL